MSDRYLEGRHAIVTGGGRGIGAAIAQELAALGAKLTLMGRNPDRLLRHASELEAAHKVKVHCVPCDVGSEASVRQAFRDSLANQGVPYVLANNAGQAEAATFVETSRELWDRMLAVNLTGTFLCTQQVLPAMIEAKAGRIVNVASTAGLAGYGKIAAYCVSKHGVVGMTRALAIEMARLGITVNAVCPGYTDGTDMTLSAIENIKRAMGKTDDEARQVLKRLNPRGTLVTCPEVANAVAWLCSPDAGAITGLAIPVAAGEVM